VTFYPAVAVAALYGGFTAGLLATVVSAALADYFWMEPVGQFAIANIADLISIIVFLTSGTLISCMAEAMFRAKALARKAEEQSRLATEREKAAVVLQQSESMYRELVQNANCAIIRLKRDGTIAFFNEYAQKFFGYSSEEIIGKHLNILLPKYESIGGSVREWFQGFVKSLEMYTNYMMENILRDGSKVSMAWTHKPIYDLNCQVREILAVGIDITEGTSRLFQKQNTLLNLAHDAILVRAKDDTILLWNRGAAETYGFGREEALGKVAHELLKTESPEPLDQILRHLAREGRWEGELTHTTSSGEEIIVESRWASEIGSDGAPVAVLEINRDITARKKAVEDLRSKMARLELVNAELQEFTFIAAHDLQEPLRKIGTFCDMAMKRCAPVLDSTSKDYLDRVVNSASRMRLLLHDLLEFSRVATRPNPPQKIDLDKIVREAADVFEASVKETGCRVQIENIPAIEADESQMLQLFQNLIGNALKFRGAETPRIKIYGKLDGRGICEVFVKDNGIGFAPQFTDLIFKPFQRLNGRNEYDGTGMGLSICRKIVEHHGGSIRAESEPGKGSTFIIRLPVKQPRLRGAIDR
jgi:PAS domain S-box-containing protein